MTLNETLSALERVRKQQKSTHRRYQSLLQERMAVGNTASLKRQITDTKHRLDQLYVQMRQLEDQREVLLTCKET